MKRAELTQEDGNFKIIILLLSFYRSNNQWHKYLKTRNITPEPTFVSLEKGIVWKWCESCVKPMWKMCESFHTYEICVKQKFHTCGLCEIYMKNLKFLNQRFSHIFLGVKFSLCVKMIWKSEAYHYNFSLGVKNVWNTIG